MSINIESKSGEKKITKAQHYTFQLNNIHDTFQLNNTGGIYV